MGYEFDLGKNLVARMHVGAKYMSEYNTGSDLDPQKLQSGYTTVNARASIGGRDGHWAVELWAQNLTDEEYKTSGYSFIAGNAVTGVPIIGANGLPVAKFVKAPAKPVPVHPSLGKELCILCWAVEDAPPDDIPNALHNWEVLAPEERWWLYTMTVATTGQAMQKGIGWRKALRAALADNPFVKGEGLSPKARRELLGHSQLSLSL